MASRPLRLPDLERQVRAIADGGLAFQVGAERLPSSLAEIEFDEREDPWERACVDNDGGFIGIAEEF